MVTGFIFQEAMVNKLLCACISALLLSEISAFQLGSVAPTLQLRVFFSTLFVEANYNMQSSKPS